MSTIVSILNRCNDWSWSFWPILRRPPKKNQAINTILVLKLTAFFGTMMAIIQVIIACYFDPRFLVLNLIISWLFFFSAYKGTFVWAWNKRAKSLQAKI